MDIFEACYKGDLDRVKKLIVEGDDINKKNSYNANPLWWASHEGHIEVVKFLVENNANVNQDKNGFSPLFVAMWNGHREVAEYLKSKGAS